MAEAGDIAIKAGGSFTLSGAAAQDSGAPWDLTGATLAAKLRDAGDAEVATLACAVVSAAGGTFTVSAADTTAWPVGLLRGDLRIDLPGGDVAFTETFTVRVERPVTR